MKILVRATNWIGDAVMSLPSLRALRNRYPGAHIAVLAKPWVAAMYEHESAIDRIIPLTGGPGLRDLGAKWQLARELRRERFDLGVLLPNSFESAAILRVAGVRRIVGYSRDGRALLLHTAVPVPEPGDIPKHQRFSYLELLRRAGILNVLPEASPIRFDGLPGARARGASLFRDRGFHLPVIGVSPGAAYGTAKRWLPERFAEAARRLGQEAGARIAVFGSSGERAVCQEVAELSGGRNFAGETSLRDYLDMTAACGLFLTNDSGAMHLAYASGVPSVTVFGPTDETATGPDGADAELVREPVECAPCLLRDCPIDHRCMTRVTADKVVQAGLRVLGQAS